MNLAFLDGYFERIGYSQSPSAELRTLRDLHLLHLQQIPYENIDVFCHQPVRLDRDSLVQKMLKRRRGGYCFEQNGLFLMVLMELGFSCRPLLARVHRNRPEPGGRTHQINLVELDGQAWVCDVGFGGSGFRRPLLLENASESEQHGEVYRLEQRPPHGYYLLRQSGDSWDPLYTFSLEQPLAVDIEMGNFYASSYPDYVFRHVIMGTRMTAQGRVTVLDHRFRSFDLIEGSVEEQIVTDFPAYLRELRECLGVELNEREQALFEARFPALAREAPVPEAQAPFRHAINETAPVR